MLWSPAASSSQQRARVLTDVKARRFAPPPLRGADGLDVGSAHARPDWLLPTMPTHTPLHVVVAVLSRMTPFPATVDTRAGARRRRDPRSRTRTDGNRSSRPAIWMMSCKASSVEERGTSTRRHRPGFNLPQFDPEPCDGFCHHKMPGAVSGRVLVRPAVTQTHEVRFLAPGRCLIQTFAPWCGCRLASSIGSRPACSGQTPPRTARRVTLAPLPPAPWPRRRRRRRSRRCKCAALCSCRLRWLPWGDQALECRPSRRARRWWVVDSHRRASGAGGPGVRPGTRDEDPISTCPRGSLLRVAATSLWGRFPTFRTLARGLLLGAHGSPLFGDLYS